MPLFQLSTDLVFPPVQMARRDGLLAVGGDLSTDRLLLAYRNGIFPWYSASPILWWSPDPRFVLYPSELRISKSMQVLLRKDRFRFTINTAFHQVIAQCRSIERQGQYDTWITSEMEKAYNTLHEKGFAHSAEAWDGDHLAGGLYGIRLGNVFFGESMFSNTSNASKFAFIRYVQHLMSQGVELIDCQVHTDHLESLGARMIPRTEFIQLVKALID